MNKEDFYKLTINQKIYFNGEETAILSLFASTCGISGNTIRLGIGYGNDSWDDICESCSLTPPKVLKRYHQYKISSNGYWKRMSLYVDEEGKDTMGEHQFSQWDLVDKIRIEDDYIEL